MYDARAVANTMLIFARAEGLHLTNLKLQKLLYLAHGTFLVQEGRGLIRGGFEAWAYGPVSRTAYHAFKHFDDLPIIQPARRFDPIARRTEEIEAVLDQAAVFTVEETVRVFGKWPEFDLVELTHRPGTPWSVTVEGARSSTNVGMVIPDEVICDCFELLAE